MKSKAKKSKKDRVVASVLAMALAATMSIVAVPAASANPIYDYALHIPNSRVECEQTLKRIRHTLVWGSCVTVPVGVTFLIGVRK